MVRKSYKFTRGDQEAEAVGRGIRKVLERELEAEPHFEDDYESTYNLNNGTTATSYDDDEASRILDVTGPEDKVEAVREIVKTKLEAEVEEVDK